MRNKLARWRLILSRTLHLFDLLCVPWHRNLSFVFSLVSKPLEFSYTETLYLPFRFSLLISVARWQSTKLGHVVQYQGSAESAAEDEYLLLWNPERREFLLEKQDAAVKNLRLEHAPAPSAT